MKVPVLSSAFLLVGLLPLSLPSTADEDQIIVTANRISQTADETLAPVTVITRQDIEQRQARTIQELLSGEAGISISNNGGPGKNTSIFMRGTESDHILVLIDGVKVGSATTGTTAFQYIPVDQIERIEVVRGPRSSLYGSEAIGGVIQIFTRKGGEGITPSFSVTAGSKDTYGGTASLSGGTSNSWFNATASGLDSEGINSCSGSSTEFAGCFTEEPDKDGYTNVSGALNGGYRFDSGAEVQLNALRAQGRTDYDGNFQNRSDFTQQVFGGRVTFMPSDYWNVKLSVGRSEDKSDNYKDKAQNSHFDTKRDSAGWQNDFAIGDNVLVLGWDYLKDSIESNEDFAEDSRNNVGVFGQYITRFYQQDVELSLRSDHNQQYDDEVTGGVGWGFNISPNLRVVASYGTAFKAPTFNELYFPNFGNPDLDPEKSKSAEIGVKGKASAVRWEMNVFETKIDDLIAYDVAIDAPSNVDETKIRGFEAVVGGRIYDYRFNSSLTLLDPENRSSGSNKGNDLPRRAKRSFKVDVDRQIDSVGVGISVLLESSRYDDLANNRKLKGFGTIDLRTEYAFLKDWLIQAKVENVMDKSYETAAFYNQLGRGYYLTLNYRPGSS